MSEIWIVGLGTVGFSCNPASSLSLSGRDLQLWYQIQHPWGHSCPSLEKLHPDYSLLF